MSAARFCRLRAASERCAFTRSRAGMALTDAGRVLAEHIPSLLSAWDMALRETRSADSRAARVAIAHNPDEWLTAIANGYGISLTPEATARFYQRPGVVYRPVTGVSPSRVGIAWPITHDNDPIIRDFIHACLLHRTSSP
jgi:DNA-binding transcriptional LysR family regulator